MIRIKIDYEKKLQIREFFKKRIIVGKNNNVDISINNKYVSKRHFAFFQKANDWYIRDLNSKNGVYLNDKKIKPSMNIKLKDQDIIRIIDASLLFDDFEKREKENKPTKIVKNKMFDIIGKAIFFILSLAVWRIYEMIPAEEKDNPLPPLTTTYNKKNDVIKNVNVTSVKSILIKAEIELKSHLEPKIELLKPPMDTRIVKIYKKEGATVKKGNLIIKLNDSSIKEKIRDLTSKLESARRNFEKFKLIYKSSKNNFESANQAFESAKKNLKKVNDRSVKSTIKYDPKTGYIDRGALVSGNLEKQEKENIKKKEADLIIAQNIYNDSLNKKNKNSEKFVKEKAELEIQKWNIKDLERRVTFTKKSLKKCKLYAKTSGIIENLSYKSGDYVKKEEVILQIIDNSHLKLQLNVPKIFRNSIQCNQIKNIIVDGNIYKGKVIFISSRLNFESGTFKVKMLINNKKQKLYSGSSVKVVLKGKEKREKLTILKNNIRSDSKGKYIFRVSKSRAERINIKTFQDLNNSYVIFSKMLHKDDLIINGDIFVKDNQQVKVITNIRGP